MLISTIRIRLHLIVICFFIVSTTAAAQDDYLFRDGFESGPVFISMPPNFAVLGETMRYQPVVSNPDQRELIFQLTAGPSTAQIDPHSGQLEWVADQTDAAMFELEVMDSRMRSDIQAFVVQIRQSRPPMITSDPVSTVEAGTQYLYQVEAVDPDSDIAEYSLISSPETMTINSATGLIEWGVSEEGQYPMHISVVDELGNMDSQVFTLVVAAPANGPEIVSLPDLIAEEGLAWSYQVIAQDPDDDVQGYGLDIAPDGMEVDAQTGLVEWLSPDPGNHSVVVTVYDSEFNFAHQEFVLEVAPHPIRIISEPPTSIEQNRRYIYHPIVTNSSEEVVSLELLQYPDGMSLDQARGEIQWIAADEGVFQVRLRAFDATGAEDVQSFQIMVSPVSGDFAVGGLLDALPAESLLIEEQITGQFLLVEAGEFFSFQMPDASDFRIEVSEQPDNFLCWAENNVGVVSGDDVDNVNVGCTGFLPGPDAVATVIESDFNSGLPASTQSEIDALQFRSAIDPVPSYHLRLNAAMDLAMGAIDPDPDWWLSGTARPYLLASPGQQLKFPLRKLDLEGNDIGAVDSELLRLEIRMQTSDGENLVLPQSLADEIVDWSSSSPGELIVNVPHDMPAGRIIVGVRPGMIDPAQRALAERWSITLMIEIWSTRPGVLEIEPQNVLFPLSTTDEPISPESLFTLSELRQRIDNLLAQSEFLLPLVLDTTANIGEGDLIDYRIDGFPYGGRILDTETRGGQLLLWVAPAWTETYDIQALGDNDLVALGVEPEFVVFRDGPPIVAASRNRSDTQTLDGDAVRSANSARNADSNQTSDQATSKLFKWDCRLGSASTIVFSPVFSLSPVDAGIKFQIGSVGLNASCGFTAESRKFKLPIKAGGPLGVLATLLVNPEVTGRIVGTGRLQAATEPGGLPGIFQGIKTSWTFRNGGDAELGLISAANDSGKTLLGVPLEISSKIEASIALAAEANIVSPGGLVGWILDKLAGGDEVPKKIGVEASAGVSLGYEVVGASAPATYQSGSETKGSAAFGVSAELSASDLVNQLAVLLLGSGNAVAIELEAEVPLKAFRFDNLFSAGEVRDDGNGTARVLELDSPPALKYLASNGLRGWIGAEDEESSVFDDEHHTVTYDIQECDDLGNDLIRAPVIACATGFFCGPTEDVQFCGGDLYVRPLRGRGSINEVVDATGKVGISPSATDTNLIEFAMDGQPLTPERFFPLTFFLLPGEEAPYNAFGACSAEPAVLTGGIVAARFPSIPSHLYDQGSSNTNINVLTCYGENGDDGSGNGASGGDRVWGSPHLVSADGLALDYYASGDYVLRRIDGVDDLEVQVRFLPGQGVSWPQAVALKVGDDVVEIHGEHLELYRGLISHRLTIWVNGELLRQRGQWGSLLEERYIQLSGGGGIYIDSFVLRNNGLGDIDPSAITVHWPAGGSAEGYGLEVASLQFSQDDALEFGNLPPIIELRQIRPPTHAGLERGLAGNNDGDPLNDLTRRNGQVIEYSDELTWTELYILFGADWLVRPFECLFSNGCIVPTFPKSPETLTPEQVALGAAACFRLVGWYREACIHDVGLLGDAEIVQALYANTSDLNAHADAIDRPGHDFPLFQLDDLGREEAGSADRYDFQITAISGAGKYLVTVRPPKFSSASFVGAGEQSFIGDAALLESLDVFCANDVHWSELGDDWPDEGEIQLWGIDPISGSARALLDHIPIPAQRIDGTACPPISGATDPLADVSVRAALAEPATIHVSNSTIEDIVVRFEPTDGLDVDESALAAASLCARCEIEIHTGAFCALPGTNLGELLIADAQGVLLDVRPLQCIPEGESGLQHNLIAINPDSGYAGLALVNTNANPSTELSVRFIPHAEFPATPASMQELNLCAGCEALIDFEASCPPGTPTTIGTIVIRARSGILLETRDLEQCIVPSSTTEPKLSAGVIGYTSGFPLTFHVEGSVWTPSDATIYDFNRSGYDDTYRWNLYPERIAYETLSQSTLSALSTGTGHRVALTHDGVVYTWGDNSEEQLGNAIAGSPSRSLPSEVKWPSEVPPRIIAIATGSRHTLALDENGQIWAWGANESHQLGVPAFEVAKRNTPEVVDIQSIGGKRVIAIAASDRNSYALDISGRLWAWGINLDGNLGNGSIVNHPTPVEVDLTPLNGARIAWISTASTANHVAIVDELGEVWTWGADSTGRLGRSTDIPGSSWQPGRVEFQGLGDDRIRWVEVGGRFNYAYDSSGRLWSWGDNNSLQLLQNTIELSVPAPALADLTPLLDAEVDAVSLALDHGILIDSDKNIWAWGENNNGQLGDGSQKDRHRLRKIGGESYDNLKFDIEYFTDPIDLSVGSQSPRVVAVANIDHRRFSVDEDFAEVVGDGLAFARTGQFFDTVIPIRSFSTTRDGITIIPALICSQYGTTVVPITIRELGGHESQQVTATIPVNCVPNTHFRLRNGSSGAMLEIQNNDVAELILHLTLASGFTINGQSTVEISLCAGCVEVIAIDQFCPVIGNTEIGIMEIRAPNQLVLDTNTVRCAEREKTIATGSRSSFAVDDDGNLNVWGGNLEGALGLGNDTSNQFIPVINELLDQDALNGLHLSSSESSHLQTMNFMGMVSGWGKNQFGQLGDGNHEALDFIGLPFSSVRRFPNRAFEGALAIEPFVELHGAGSYSIGRDRVGRVWTWGSAHGQLGLLGTGSAYDDPLPGIVPINEPIIDIAAGSTSVLALSSDGARIWGWGNVTLSDDSSDQTDWAALPATLNFASIAGMKFTDVAVGSAHFLMLDESGQIWAWGRNQFGQLGDGTQQDQPVPVHVDQSALNGVPVVGIAAADNSNFAVDVDGRLWAWGSNSVGQLGIGSDLSAILTPLPIVFSTLEGSTIIEFEPGSRHSLVKDDQQCYWSWGNGLHGELGTGGTQHISPTLLPSISAESCVP